MMSITSKTILSQLKSNLKDVIEPVSLW